MDSSGFSTRLANLIGAAGGRAVKSGRRVLVSLSERIPVRDPLAALEACYRSLASEMQLADHVSGMAYWARPSQGFAIAAFGAAAVLSPTGQDRFAAVDEEWRWLLSNALIESDSVESPGVGPILIGGFAFDAEGPRTDRWRGFPSAHMIVPQLHLTSGGGESWLTVSALVGEDGKSETSVETLIRYRDVFKAGDLDLPRLDGISPIQVSDDLPEMEWRTIVGDAVREIRAGDMRKVVLARSVHGSAAKPVNVFEVLGRLADTHRDALIFGYWRDNKVFVGASPERLAQLDGREISASSLAGTVRRGVNPEEDAQLAAELKASEKDLVEHAAVREMLYEILSGVGEHVSAPEAPEVLTLSNVHHLHTEVRADLCDDYSLLDVIGRLHPTPAVGGTPRDRALEFIRENEQLDRGWYAAPVGWLDRSRGEFAVALRSGIIEADEFALYAGCGIVADSDPEEELAESILKLEPMRLAIAGDADT